MPLPLLSPDCGNTALQGDVGREQDLFVRGVPSRKGLHVQNETTTLWKFLRSLHLTINGQYSQ